jgi:hypothetical protein
MAALAGTTIGFASGAGAAGTVPKLVKPTNGIEAAGASTYLSGYQATPTGGLASASVTFTVPTITCSAALKASGAGQWEGVFTDSLSAYALIFTDCTSSGPLYEFDQATPAGQGVEAGVVPGDTVVASLFQSSSSTFAELHDLTQNIYYFADYGAPVGDTVVDIGSFNELAAFGFKLPPFTTVKMTNATVNGDYLGFDSPTHWNAVNGGDLLVKSGSLKTSGTGSTFSLVFKHSS